MFCTILLTPSLLLTTLFPILLHVHLSLASTVALPAVGYIHPLTYRSPPPITLTKRARDILINGPEDIPATCKSACPDSFMKGVSSCPAKPEAKGKACLCKKGQDFLDQWSSCDSCLEQVFSVYKSMKPDCTKTASEGARVMGSPMVLQVAGAIVQIQKMSRGSIERVMQAIKV